MERRAGGQAVVGGVMMRGNDRWAVAVRSSSGAIEVTSGPLAPLAPEWRKVPFVRGLLALAEAVPIGARAMRWSAVHGSTRSEPADPIERVARRLALVAALAASVTLPTYGADRLVGGLGVGFVSAVTANVLAVGILLGYAALVGRLGELRRLFENHGAEHKVVAAFEAGVPLTPAGVACFSTRHLRCGTSLLVVVAAISGAVALLLAQGMLPGPVASPLVLVPVVVALATEAHLRASANVHRRWVRALLRPGLALQRLTTREPTHEQLEVAIVALEASYGLVPVGTAAEVPITLGVAVPPSHGRFGLSGRRC